MYRSNSILLIAVAALIMLAALTGDVSATAHPFAMEEGKVAAIQAVEPFGSSDVAWVEEPTAVVLSSFSADIRGPSRALWISSAAILLLGFVLVRSLYARRE